MEVLDGDGKVVFVLSNGPESSGMYRGRSRTKNEWTGTSRGGSWETERLRRCQYNPKRCVLKLLRTLKGGVLESEM